MAHFQQLKFVETISLHMNKNQDWQGIKLLEVGAHDVNGSIRQFFVGSDYTGVDLSEGEGVDIVASGHELDLPDASFDISISCECFEHNPEWVGTFSNMHRMTQQGGVVIISCASKGRPEHGTTRTSPEASPGTQDIGWDYYKNLSQRDFDKHFDLK